MGISSSDSWAQKVQTSKDCLDREVDYYGLFTRISDKRDPIFKDKENLVDGFFSEDCRFYFSYNWENILVWKLEFILRDLFSKCYSTVKIDSVTLPIVKENLARGIDTFLTLSFVKNTFLMIGINDVNHDANLPRIRFFEVSVNEVHNIVSTFILDLLETNNLVNIKLSESGKYLTVLTTSEIGVYSMATGSDLMSNSSKNLQRRAYSLKQKMENFHTRHNFIMAKDKFICIADDHVGILNDYVLYVKESSSSTIIPRIEIIEGFYSNKTVTCINMAVEKNLLGIGSEEGELVFFNLLDTTKKSYKDVAEENDESNTNSGLNSSITSLCFIKDKPFVAYSTESGYVKVLDHEKMEVIVKYQFKVENPGNYEIRVIDYNRPFFCISLSKRSKIDYERKSLSAEKDINKINTIIHILIKTEL